jgi:phosphoenolpyruvate carboxykinase (ATP)
LDIPTQCSGVDAKVLDPVNTWESKTEYMATLKKLAGNFKKNFERYAEQTGKEVIEVGPKV